MQTKPSSQKSTTPNDSTAKHYRYPGADSFRDNETDSRLFFGRDDEVTEVLNRLLSNKLLVMFAKSGLGKTSLLQAGLFPKLRERDFLPIRLRFNIRPENIAQDSQKQPASPSWLARLLGKSAKNQQNLSNNVPTQLVEKVNQHLFNELKIAVKRACDEQDIIFSEGEGETYWEYFNTAVFSKGDRFLVPVLILDQFEEIFTLQDDTFRKQLGEQLGHLVSGQMPDSVRERIRAGEQLNYPSTPPNLRLMISLREDAVGALQELAVYLPGILSQRFRLTQLDAEHARTAIIEPAQLNIANSQFIAQPFSYQTETVDAILKHLQGRDHDIEPFQLQLLCRNIEQQVITHQANSDEAIVVDLHSYLGGTAGMDGIIKQFYQTAIKSLRGWRVRRKARKVCEAGLINTEGRRESLSGKKIIDSFGLEKEQLVKLVDKKVLRREERLSDFYYEISHDSLASAVFKAKRSKTKLQWIATTAVLVLVFAGIAGWQWQQTQQASQQAITNLDEYKQQVKALVALDRPDARTIKEPEMVAIPKGRFMMGSKTGNKNELPLHEVFVNAFSMGAYEVTFEEYDQFAASVAGYELPDDKGWGRGKRPVIYVSWEDAKAYANWLKEKTGKAYRLPTEAEWEYAARAGTQGDYYWEQGDSNQFAWFSDNSGDKTQPVGEKKPNGFGLYDMSGNVLEWVQDCYVDNYKQAPTDGSAWETPNCGSRVLRGGSWFSLALYLRSAHRYWNLPGYRYFNVGFRLAQD